jgi:hypothetical protein
MAALPNRLQHQPSGFRSVVAGVVVKHDAVDIGRSTRTRRSSDLAQRFHGASSWPVPWTVCWLMASGYPTVASAADRDCSDSDNQRQAQRFFDRHGAREGTRIASTETAMGGHPKTFPVRALQEGVAVAAAMVDAIRCAGLGPRVSP